MWAQAIPLVTLLAVVFAAGMHVADTRAIRRELAALKDDLKRSAEAQGTRIGAVEDEVSVLKDFKARTEAAREAERDFSGRVRG